MKLQLIAFTNSNYPMFLTRIVVKSRHDALKSVRLKSFLKLTDIFRNKEKNDIAIIDPDGSKTTCLELKDKAEYISNLILRRRKPLKYIACYHNPGSEFVVSMFASWYAGSCFVPINIKYPKDEIKYILQECSADLILTSKDLVHNLSDSGVPLLITDNNDNYQRFDNNNMNLNTSNDDALLIFTSGTTGRPKGVVHTHTGISYMINSLVQAWEIQSSDYILHFLPLHHMHGLLNKLFCLLYVGGTIEFMSSSSSFALWERLQKPAMECYRLPTIFMGVPTNYAKLIESSKDIPSDKLQRALQCIRQMRVMTCGSAPLPSSIMNTWFELTGHLILERYGMTEFGMALSNPYKGGNRKPGTVGFPLPYVQCRLVDENENEVTGYVEDDLMVEDSVSKSMENNENKNTGELRIKVILNTSF